jgi:hypothetical protein
VELRNSSSFSHGGQNLPVVLDAILSIEIVGELVGYSVLFSMDPDSFPI